MTIIMMMAAWAWIRTDETLRLLQSAMPVKSATKNSADVAQAQANLSKNIPQGDEGAPETGLKEAALVSALPAAPIDGLFETVDGKQLPVIRVSDGTTPFNAYKKPFAHSGLTPVAVVIMDFGLSDSMSRSILDSLPPGITLSLSPYAAETAKWAAAARSFGHEFWLSLPMETDNFVNDDTGPETILAGGNVQENAKRMAAILGSASGYAGLITQEGHNFTKTTSGAATVTETISQRGLGLAETSIETADIFTLSGDSHAPYFKNDLWIDTDAAPEDIEKMLNELQMLAKEKGGATAFAHPTPALMTILQKWIGGLEANGLELAPLSAMGQS